MLRSSSLIGHLRDPVVANIRDGTMYIDRFHLISRSYWCGVNNETAAILVVRKNRGGV